MNAKSFLDKANDEGRVFEVGRFEGSECIGRGRAMALDPMISFGDHSKSVPDHGEAVMLEPCGDPAQTKIAAGAIISYWTRPGDGHVISSAADVAHGTTFEMPPMTEEDATAEYDDHLIEEDDRDRAANIEAAERKGWQFQPGNGWVDQDGVIRLDDVGRAL